MPGKKQDIQALQTPPTQWVYVKEKKEYNYIKGELKK